MSCASLEYDLPETFNLTGNWVLDEDASDASFDLSKIWDSEEQGIITGDVVNPTDSATFIVHDFPVVVSNEISIEQNEDSMGIQYEEAPYEDFKWGKQVRDGWRIEVGWDGQSLVVSKQRNSVQGSETFSLNDAGRTLHVRVRINSRDNKYTFVRVYTRQD